MKIVLAKKAGFCMGVRRAMEIVIKAVEEKKGRIYTYGPLIHNPQALEALKRKDVVMISHEMPPPSSRVVVRAHGIPPTRYKEIQDAGLSLCDATCPRVKRVQRIIEEHVSRGYFIVIVGDKGHAEVLGLMGYADKDVIVIETPEEVDQLPGDGKYCVVAQTTQNERHYAEITERIKALFPDSVVHNTLCFSTSERQEEARELAKKVDAMVVVGGRESANTSRLTRLVREEGTPVFHVETEKELDRETLSGYDTIGVTAGASTPNWMIRKVLSRLEEIQISRYSFPLRHFYSFFIFFIKSNLYVAAGAACLVYTSCLLQSIAPRLSFMAIASLYIFAMHVLHYLTKGREIQLEEPTRGDFVEKYKNILIALSVVSILCSLCIAFFLGTLPFWLLVLATILGILYNIRIIPARLLRFFYYQRLRDIPASKDVFMALAWAAITVVLPLLAEGRILFTENLLVTFLLIYVLVYNRSIFFDIKEIQGDKMVGRETMPIFIGKEKTKVVIVALMLLAFTGLIYSTYRGHLQGIGYLLTILLIYNAAYLYLYHKRVFTHSLLCEFIADGNFILAGMLSLFWKNFLA